MEYLKKSRFTNTKQDGYYEDNHYTKVFAKGYCFAKIFMFFVIGCIAGTYYEEILTFFQKGVWESRSGLIYGPFNPIYGVGFAGFIALLGKNIRTRKWYWTYFWSCIIGGVAEYSLCLIGEILFHGRSWDYTGYFLNIGGRTTVPFMLFWGIGGMIMLYIIYPFIGKLIEKIPYKFAKIAYPILLVFMIFNMVISYSALFRQGQRHEGKHPITVIGEIYDTIYDDDFLYMVYPNMNHEE